MNGATLLAIALVLGVIWRLPKSQDRPSRPHDYGFSRREFVAALPGGALAAALFVVSTVAFLLFAPVPR